MIARPFLRRSAARFARPGLSTVLVAVGFLAAGCAPVHAALEGSPSISVEQGEAEALPPPIQAETSGPAGTASQPPAPSQQPVSGSSPSAEASAPTSETPSRDSAPQEASEPPAEEAPAPAPAPPPSDLSGPVENLIAFVRGTEIFLMNPDGTGKRKLIDGGYPAWSPDHRRIAFANGGSGIYVVDADGNNLRQVTTHGRSPDWSPDGSQLVFESFTQSDTVVSIVNIDGTGERWLADFPSGDPAWSPDGSLIAFTGKALEAGTTYVPGVFVIRPDGTDVRRLTKGWGSTPAWKPDGTRIALTRSDGPDNASVFLIDRDGGNVTRLTDGQSVVSSPSWSPDGTRMVLVHNSVPPGTYTLAIMNADGSDLHDLTSGPFDGSADW